MNILELAMDNSLDSLGSNHTLFLPHLRTEAAKRFCRRRLVILLANLKRNVKKKQTHGKGTQGGSAA